MASSSRNTTTTALAPPPTLLPCPPVSLYVGDLDPAVSESQLYERFNSAAPVISVRVCRDSATGRSLCYAYVNLHSNSDATKAIKMLNSSLLNGKAIRINWSRRDPHTRKNSDGNLFIKNLNESIDHNGLNEIFAKYGNIISSKVAMGENGKSKGFGFVQFEREEDANIAMANLNGATVGEKTLYVGKFIKKSERAVPNKENCFKNLYVKNLDAEVVTEDMLKETFSKIGDISACAIMKDDQGKSRGFGFVCYISSEDAKKAVDVMNGKILGSKALYVGRAQKKEERKKILQKEFEERRMENILKFQGSNVYVKNIHDSVEDDQLKEHFSSCGNITSVKLMRDQKGFSKGFGFVCFSSPEEANNAVSTFNSTMFLGKPLYVAIAQLKSVRHAQLQVLHSQCLSGLATASPPALRTSYPPMCFSHPQGVMVPHFSNPHHEAIMYPYISRRLGWKIDGSFPTQGFHDNLPLPMRKQKHSKGQINGFTLPQVPNVSHWQLSVNQHSARHISKGGNNEKTNGQDYPNASMVNGLNRADPVPLSSAKDSAKGLSILSSQLTRASPERQKQILGEHLFPLVKRLQHEFAGKITGMLLEMDNAELLSLLDSSDALAAKVDEAVKVLKLSKADLDSKNVPNGSHLPVEVAVK